MPRSNDPNAGNGHLKGSKASTPHQGVANVEWWNLLQKLKGKPVAEKPANTNPSWNYGKAKKPSYWRKKVKPK